MLNSLDTTADERFTRFLGGLERRDGVFVLSSKPYAFDEAAYDAQYGYDAQAIERLTTAVRRLLDQLGVNSGGRCLEIGCGTGVFSAALYRANRFRQLVLTDPSIAFLRLCRDRALGGAATDGTSFLAMGGEDMGKLPVDCFSLIALRYVLHHVLDWRQFLRDAHRTLRPGGVLLMEEPFAEGYLMQAALIHFMPPSSASSPGGSHSDDWYAQYLKNSVASYILDRPDKASMEDKHLFLAHELMTEAQDLGFVFRFYPAMGLDSFAQDPPQRDEFLPMLLHNCRVNLGFPEALVQCIADRFAAVGDYLKPMMQQRACLFSRGVFAMQKR
jgi:ubiquinone/menaquinone biosynthesis C-methylase UbiE